MNYCTKTEDGETAAQHKDVNRNIKIYFAMAFINLGINIISFSSTTGEAVA